jgi:hypothetical protein
MPTKQFVEKQTVKEISKEKEIAKEKHEKEKAEKEKHEKVETKESKDAKDTPDKQHKEKAEKEKHEKEVKEQKEKSEKHEHKEKELVKEHGKEVEHKQILESVQTAPGAPHDAVTAQAQAEAASPAKLPEKFYLEKIHPEKTKIEKFEKHEIHEKLPILETKQLRDTIVAGPVHVGPGVPVEDRLTALEAAYAQLAHFIPQDLRPDLSKGALKQEPADDKPAPAPEEDKK